MTDLITQDPPNWHDTINQLEQNELALGGHLGNLNVAPRQLAENTFYLKSVIETKFTALDKENAAQDLAISTKAEQSEITLLNEKNSEQDLAISTKAEQATIITLDEKNATQDTAIEKNRTNVASLLTLVNENKTDTDTSHNNLSNSLELFRNELTALSEGSTTLEAAVTALDLLTATHSTEIAALQTASTGDLSKIRILALAGL